MTWPDWLWSPPPKPIDDKTREVSPAADNPPSKPAGSWETNLNSTDWSHYTSPQTITACVVTTATTLALIRLYKTYLRRIPTVNYLKPGLFRRRTLYGYVTSVGDADNFQLFHTPGGRLAGWGWLPGRRVRTLQKMTKPQLKGNTIHVRIAGVDAPELGHFGKEAQPYGQEALTWLRSSVLHRFVRVQVYRRDQYERVVCMVWRRKWLFFKSDVGYEMLKSGLATVYEAKFGSEFGNKEKQYRVAEKRAKEQKVGMWQEPGMIDALLGRGKSIETPREYKTRMAAQDKKTKSSDKAK